MQRSASTLGLWLSWWMNPNRKAQPIAVSDFHATFNACLHMHELFTAPCVESGDARSLGTRKSSGGRRGGVGGAFMCLPVSCNGGWWRRRVTWQLHCCSSLHHRLITELRLQPADGICFLFPLTVGGEIFIQQRLDAQKKEKKKKYGFLCDRSAATASAFRQTVTQESDKRGDYSFSSVLLKKVSFKISCWWFSVL